MRETPSEVEDKAKVGRIGGEGLQPVSHWLGCKVRIKSRTPRDFIQSLEVTLAADSRLGFLLAFLLAEDNLRVSVLTGKRLTRQLAILHFLKAPPAA